MNYSKVDENRRIKQLLKRTWSTFFSHFGYLTPIQLKSIPIILKKQNAILVSSTASGKTEAVVAPLTELFLREKWGRTSIVYISPTRALVNDLYSRLKDRLEELNVKLGLKTGDRPYINRRKLPDFLITTPESLDSLLCRYTSIFKRLRAVVLDEIHLIDNTYRGDQLRILLRRLHSLRKKQFNVYALSATLSDPEKIGMRYLSNFTVIEAPGTREIIYTLVRSLEDIYDYCLEENLKKILIFCNKRTSVETLAVKAKQLWGRNFVVVHHGSLSRSERENAENFMKNSNRAVCIATMTLEIGIDIGDVDAIVLAEIPWSLSALLQRVGRGNRRTNKCRVFAIFSSLAEKEILEEMLRIAKTGYTEDIQYSPDLSVVVQQLFSLLFSNPMGLKHEYFHDIFRDICTEAELTSILTYLIGKGWVEKRYGKYYATTKLMDFGEKGQIHSNIPSNQAVKVIDITRNSVIGQIQLPVDNIFAFGGKIWEVKRITQTAVYVRKVSKKASSVKFRPNNSKGFFYNFLPPELRSSNANKMDI